MPDRTLLLCTAAAAGVVGFALGRRDTSLKSVLNGNHKLLSPSDKKLARALITQGNVRLLRSWPVPGTRDAEKLQLLRAAADKAAETAESLEALRLAVLKAPEAPRKPHVLEHHGDSREDPYYWIRDDARKNKDMLQYLEGENAYTQAVMATTEEVQERLYAEMRGRIQEADTGVPVRRDGYFYYTRTEEGQQYKLRCRRKVPGGAAAPPPLETEVMDESAPEEVLLDENAMAAKHKFFMVGDAEESPNGQLYAWTQDLSGGETYTIHVKDLATGKEIIKPIPGAGSGIVWAADSATLFYTTMDELWRPYRVYRHTIGSGAPDVLVYEEQDTAFGVYISRSRSEGMLFISASSSITSEERFLPADTPQGEWTLAAPRAEDVQYELYHRNDHFFIVYRDQQHPNSELRVAPVSDPTQHTVVVPHNPDVKLEAVSVSKNHIVLFQRIEGLQQATVFPLPADGSAPASLEGGRKVAFEEPAYSLEPGAQGDFDSPLVRLTYTSLTTPTSVIDHNMVTGASATKKVQPVLGGFQQELYKTERHWATAADGTRVPISLVYRTDVAALDGSAPCLLNGYGSYEISNDPYFSSSRLSLLDRGFVYAIAHIRGGGEMGRKWYEHGKYEHKVNTFTDFVACAEYVVEHKICHPQKLCIEGRSAGGLLMGAVLNMRPDLFSAALAGVPFVDCLTTMLDPTIPLTIPEWDEWGNPIESAETYRVMKGYSPMDNVRAAEYPHMLVTAGLHDPRVGYWEPTKWVAKIRALQTGSNLLLLKVDLGAGHFSKSGRFEKLREVALEYAFLLKTQGMLRVQPPEAPAAKL